MIIKTENLPEMDGERNPLVMKKVIHRDDQSNDISITWVKIWGHHKKLVCHVSDRAYYIIDGEGEFNVTVIHQERLTKEIMCLSQKAYLMTLMDT